MRFTSRAPHRHRDGDHDGGDTAGCRDEAAVDENVVGVGVVGEPPPEEGRRPVERPAEELEPRRTELRLEAELPRVPLHRHPEEDEHNGADDQHLAPEDLRRGHGDQKSRRFRALRQD
jgi:hypothetical protein